MSEQETNNSHSHQSDQSQPLPKRKFYEVIDSDIFLNKKLIPEGTVIDTFDASLSDHLRELSEAEIAAIPNFYSTVNQSASRKRGRPRKL